MNRGPLEEIEGLLEGICYGIGVKQRKTEDTHLGGAGCSFWLPLWAQRGRRPGRQPGAVDKHLQTISRGSSVCQPRSKTDPVCLGAGPPLQSRAHALVGTGSLCWGPEGDGLGLLTSTSSRRHSFWCYARHVVGAQYAFADW